LSVESPGDSGATGGSDALGEPEEPEGLPDGDDPGVAVPPVPPDGLDVGLEEGDGLDEPDGDAVGEGLDEAVGDEVGEGDGLDDAAVVMGGATAGGTVAPDARSCCQDQPTDPPAGTVSEPTPYDE
jgi:hypothetical protein